MNNYKKFGLIAGQVFIGLAFAIVGGIAWLIISYVMSLISGVYSSLFQEVLHALIACYVGLLTGIAFDGYKFLKRNGRQTEFVRHFLQSLIGLTVGLIAVYFMASSASTASLVAFSAVVLPLMGTIIGFDFRLNRDKPVE
jgi:hypothetical protein